MALPRTLTAGQYQIAPGREEPLRFKAKNVAALLLGGWSDRMQVDVDPDIGVSAKNRWRASEVTAWPENLAITTPPEPHPGSTIQVSKANVATRMPKPKGA